MDRIPDLSAFQGVLLSANKHYSFATLQFRKDNENKINYIVRKLYNFLKEKNYITQSGVLDEKREDCKKLALYLVLNAELPVLEEMTGLPGGVGALVRTLPALPGPLLAELLRGLHMRPFLYEIVAFCRPALALQLADACIANMEHDNPIWYPQYPVRLAEALYRLTCRLHFARAPPTGAPATALAGLRACIGHLTPLSFNIYNMRVRTLIHSFTLLETCYDHFTSVQRFQDKDFADIYRATHDPDGLAPMAFDFKICDSPDRAISESLRSCNGLLLDHCAVLVKDVSVTDFRSWSHSTVGFVCERYVRMNAMLRSISDAADHCLVDMLEVIAIQSVNLEKVAHVMNPDVIVADIRARDATSTAWLDTLLHWPALCRHPGSLQVLLSEAAMLDENQTVRLFSAMGWLLKEDRNDADLQRTVAIEAFLRCSDSTQEQIVAEQFQYYFHNTFMTMDFEVALTETFDRLAAGDAGPGDALTLFVQNPGRTLERLVWAAGDGAAQTESMLRVAEHLGECRERRYNWQPEPALVSTVETALDDAAAAEDEARCQQLARFAAELVRHGLLSFELLLQCKPEVRAAIRAIKEHDNKSLEELRPENLKAESCKTASSGHPAEDTTSSGLSSQLPEAKPSSGSSGQLTKAKPLSALSSQPTEATTSSSSSDQLAKAKPLSGLSSQPTEATTSSSSSDQLAKAKPLSGLSSQPTEATTSSSSSDQLAKAKPLSGLSSQPTEATTSSSSSDQLAKAKPLSGLSSQPTEATTSSSSSDQLAKAKPLSGLSSQATEAKPSSGSSGQSAKATRSSGLSSQQTEAKSSSFLLGQAANAKPSSGLFSQLTEAKPSFWSFGQPAEVTTSSAASFGNPAEVKPFSGLSSQPTEATTSSSSSDQLAKAKPLSALSSQATEAKPSSGSSGQSAKATMSSGLSSQQTEAKLSSFLLGQAANAKPSSGLFSQLTEAKPSFWSFGQPAEVTTSSAASFGNPAEVKPLSGLSSQPTEATTSSSSSDQLAKAKPLSGLSSQSTEATMSSSSSNQLAKAKPLSALSSQATEAKPSSGSSDQSAKATRSSGLSSQQTEAKSSSFLLGQAANAKPSSGLFSQLTEAKPSFWSFGQPAEVTTSSAASFSNPAEVKPFSGLSSQPTEATTSSSSSDQLAKAKPLSALSSQATEAKPSSGSSGQSAKATMSSGLSSQQTEAKSSSFLLGQAANAKPSSGLFSQLTEAKPSFWSFGQPAEVTTSSAASFGNPAEVKLLTEDENQPGPGRDSCIDQVTSLVYKCSACGLCFDRHEAMYKHFTNCDPFKKMTRIHCICGLEFDRNNYEYHCEVHRKSTELLKKTLAIDDYKDVDVRGMKENSTKDDKKFSTNDALEESTAVHKFHINIVPLYGEHTSKSTDILAAKISIVYKCKCRLCFERPYFLFNHINNNSCYKKITRVHCICGLEFDMYNYNYHYEIHRNYDVLRVKKFTIVVDKIVFEAGVMQEFAEDKERKAVITTKDAQVQTVDENVPLLKSSVMECNAWYFSEINRNN